MKFLYILLISLFILPGVCLKAQVVPSPAKAQSQPILLTGATAHLGNGQVIENAAVAFDQGKLTYVGASSAMQIDASKYQNVDISGKHVYPGLILLNTDLGLTEIGAVSATNDDSETGAFNPSVRSLVAYNTDSHVIPTTRVNGILLAQPVPGGGIVTGQSSVVQLDAWNWEDAAFKIDEGIHVDWPSKFRRPRWWLGETESRKNDDYPKIIQTITKALKDGAAYAELDQPEMVNIQLEAMKGLYDGSKTFYIHADYSRAIVEAIQLAQENGVKKVVLVGGEDAYYVKDFLKSNKIPVILSKTHSLPARTMEDVDMPYKLAALLHKEGILVSTSYQEAARARNLPFNAGTTVAYGLSKEEALSLITLNAAKILGIEDRVGSLETGKDATLVVSEGDLLDMRSNEVIHAFISGREISLDNKHKQLYERFKAKYDGE